MPTEKASRIASAFMRYAKTGDKYTIENFSRDDIEATLLQYHADRGGPHYMAMERRIEELKEKGSSSKKINLSCGPLAKKKCYEHENIKLEFSETNVFVDIPYTNYEDCEKVIRDLFSEIGLTPIIAKDRLTSNDVLCKVCKMVNSCKYGITDISSGSNSVVYEYGLMHGLGMKVCLLLRKGNESKFTDITGLEHLPYNGLKSFKITLAEWILQNIEEVNKEVVKKIILEEQKIIKSSGDSPLFSIIPKAISLTEGDEEFKRAIILAAKEKAEKNKKKVKNKPCRLIYCVPTLATSQFELLPSKNLIESKEKIVLFPMSNAEFPCSGYQLKHAHKELIYSNENKRNDFFRYFNINTSGLVFFEEKIYEYIDKNLLDNKKYETVINTFVTVDKLYKTLMVIRQFYDLLGFSGEIDLVYEFVNIENLKVYHTDNMGFDDDIGQLSDRNDLKIEKTIDIAHLFNNLDDLILEIYEEFLMAAGVSEPYNRHSTRWELEKVKQELYAKDICPDCNKYYKPRNRDKCLYCLDKLKEIKAKETI